VKRAADRERILVVDDAPATLEVLERSLAGEGYRLATAGDVDAALAILRDTAVDLVVTDLRMPGASGLELVRHVRENLEDTGVIMITGFATVEGAVQAMRAGAEDYLAKPFTDEELFASVRRVLEMLHMRRAARARTLSTPRSPEGLLGESEVMTPVFRAIAKAAATSATVFISGESGTGKERVARAIHYSGPHASAPFVAVNCGAIPESLLEAELFGFVKGAFTGAVESRAGFFQTADGGTIFLDEISETSPAMQVKLLRVLQDKEVCMVGTTRPRKVDVRIVASTNRAPETLVAKGILREDLFYRLNVVPISIPPLRERADDVLLLAHHFARRFAEEGGKPAPAFTARALRALTEYSWPGNVRELENVVQSAVVMTEGDSIDVTDLPSLLRFQAPREATGGQTLAEVEARHVRRVLANCGGNRTRAAAVLGIDRKTLREKLKLPEPAGT
jgi:DNA-binding NtrC family response regulator